MAMQKTMEQMLDEWPGDGSEVATPARKKKSKVAIPKSRLRLWKQKLFGTNRRGYELEEAISKSIN